MSYHVEGWAVLRSGAGEVKTFPTEEAAEAHKAEIMWLGEDDSEPLIVQVVDVTVKLVKE